MLVEVGNSFYICETIDHERIHYRCTSFSRDEIKSINGLCYLTDDALAVSINYNYSPLDKDEKIWERSAIKLILYCGIEHTGSYKHKVI